MTCESVYGGALYISISGGGGQLYETCFLLLARARRMRIYLHHHSFAYLNRASWLMRLLTLVAGPSSVHIALSPGMAACLKRKYAKVQRTVPISNVVFFSSCGAGNRVSRSCMKTIGYISNISVEKGIFEFLDLVEACERDGLPIKAKLAGPFQDACTERAVRQRLQGLWSIEYVGSRYGSEKWEFFDSIDTLIFPSQYVNEAEPLTIHEALQRNVPVIASGRGCIPEIAKLNTGLLVSPGEDFIASALYKIKQWVSSPEAYEAASRAAGEYFDKAVETNGMRWGHLCEEMLRGVIDMSNSSSRWSDNYPKSDSKN